MNRSSSYGSFVVISRELDSTAARDGLTSSSLLDLLARTLGVARETILAWRAHPLEFQAAFRDPHLKVAASLAAPATPSREPNEDDEQIRDVPFRPLSVNNADVPDPVTDPRAHNLRRRYLDDVAPPQ